MKLLTIFTAFLALAFTSLAQDKDKGPSAEELAAFKKLQTLLQTLKYQDGEVTLAGGKAKLTLTPDFQYLAPAEARKVLVDVWGNPPAVASAIEGMIIQKGTDFLAEDAWAAIIQWKEDGYVKDEEFASTDFNKMLTELKEQSKEQSKERVKQGYGKLEVAAWAQPPQYDKTTHKLYYAKALDVDGPVQGLNYDIRVLGRAGVLEVSIISSMPYLADIDKKAPEILGMVDFTAGNRYADYKDGDKVAAYGIAGLIAGGVLAKAGFFKGLLLLLVKLWKPVLIGVALIGAFIAKMLGRKKAA